MPTAAEDAHTAPRPPLLLLLLLMAKPLQCLLLFLLLSQSEMLSASSSATATLPMPVLAARLQSTSTERPVTRNKVTNKFLQFSFFKRFYRTRNNYLPCSLAEQLAGLFLTRIHCFLEGPKCNLSSGK